jgi:CubicO group peptidase (beta-lactamase class C family)
MFVPSGALAGAQVLLRPDTLSLMTANQLTSDQRARSEMFGLPIFAEGHGFGMGVAVVMEPEAADPTLCGGSIGSVGWPGAYGGWWRADPADNSVLVFLSHNMVELDQLAAGVGLGVFTAIAQFQALASRHSR